MKIENPVNSTAVGKYVHIHVCRFEPWETTGKPNQFAKVKAYLLPVPGLHYSIYLYGKISILYNIQDGKPKNCSDDDHISFCGLLTNEQKLYIDRKICCGKDNKN